MKRMKRKEGLLKRFVRFLLRRDLLANKFVALSIIFLGYVSVLVLNEATAFAFMLMIGLPLFFAKENYVE